MSARIRSMKQRARRGATAVEFALVLPIVFFAFFGLWEYARLEMIRQATATACYDGAREGTLPGSTTAEMQAAAQRILDIYLISGATIEPQITDRRASCEITIPVDENTWLAYFVLPNRNIESRCDFNRELF